MPLDIFTGRNFGDLLTLGLFLYGGVGMQDPSFYVNSSRVFLLQEVHSLVGAQSPFHAAGFSLW